MTKPLTPSAEIQKRPVWDETIKALRRSVQTQFAKETFDELIVYLRTLELEHWVMKRQLQTDKERFTEPKYGCEWKDAADDIDSCLSSLTIHD